MKTKIFGGIAVLVIAVVTAWNVNINSHKSNNLLIGINEIEALSEPEIGVAGTNWKWDWMTCTTEASVGVGATYVKVTQTALTEVCCYGSGSCWMPAGC